MAQKKRSSSAGIARTNYGIFAVAVAVYCLGIFLAPVRENSYDLSVVESRLLSLTLVIPIVVIWALAVFGAVRFKQYADKIKHDTDGRALNVIANGLLLLAFGSIAGSLFGLLRNYTEYTSTDYQILAILSSYWSVLLLVTVFATMYVGSKRLLEMQQVTTRDIMTRRSLYTMLFITTLTVIYTALLFTNGYRNSTPDPTKYSSFYMNDVQLLLTIAIPTAIAWFVGAQAIVNLQLYSQIVKGSIYRRTFGLLSKGLSAVLLFYVLISVLTALSGLFAGISLAYLLVLVYVILLAYGVGFAVIARAAKKLSLIEEV